MLCIAFAIDCWLQSAASLRRWRTWQKNLLRSDKNFISLVSSCFLSNNSLSACPPSFCQWVCLCLCTVLSLRTSPGCHRNTAALGWAVADRVTVRLNHLHGVLHCGPPAPGRGAQWAGNLTTRDQVRSRSTKHTCSQLLHLMLNSPFCFKSIHLDVNGSLFLGDLCFVSFLTGLSRWPKRCGTSSFLRPPRSPRPISRKSICRSWGGSLSTGTPWMSVSLGRTWSPTIFPITCTTTWQCGPKTSEFWAALGWEVHLLSLLKGCGTELDDIDERMVLISSLSLILSGKWPQAVRANGHLLLNSEKVWKYQSM